MNKKIISMFLIIIFVPIIAVAHSGRTDSNGGHYDSSTGEYHYHHGYPAHQHNADGSCPYETSTYNNTEALVIKGTDDGEYYKNKTNELQSKVDELDSQIVSKDFKIAELEEQIQKSKEEFETQKENLHIIYIFIIAVICCISYFKFKDLKEENKK